ncbi:unnamed protein product [Callosobruchus maculatus]|uniref:Uncharacterized protein n=1 Tax=Callosobruchus maculatus TaxID=64391 RepID=A0A653CFP7_CALMS|nr:unnamed protein product [Callosobruchus maculatus]
MENYMQWKLMGGKRLMKVTAHKITYSGTSKIPHTAISEAVTKKSEDQSRKFAHGLVIHAL